jgi:hypothetical protein
LLPFLNTDVTKTYVEWRCYCTHELEVSDHLHAVEAVCMRNEPAYPVDRTVDVYQVRSGRGEDRNPGPYAVTYFTELTYYLLTELSLT